MSGEHALLFSLEGAQFLDDSRHAVGESGAPRIGHHGNLIRLIADALFHFRFHAAMQFANLVGQRIFQMLGDLLYFFADAAGPPTDSPQQKKQQRNQKRPGCKQRFHGGLAGKSGAFQKGGDNFQHRRQV